MTSPRAGDYLDFLSRSAGPAEWIALSRVFLPPRFVEVRGGCVLWDRSYEPGNFRLWYDELKGGDTASIEAKLNEFRLWLYVDFDDDPTSRSNALDLAREIARAWRLSLGGDAFPGRAFDVRAA
ncbi:hypothetical protein GTV15_05875, partial [Streptomyces sp. SID7803]|nr:hypothetical protein [Streptomyces sp. SID7803]